MKTLFTQYLKACLAAGFFFLPSALYAQSQNPLENGKLSGSFLLDAQRYFEDSLIGANKPESEGNPAVNAFFNLLYETPKLKVGVRYEAYLPPLIGFDANYNGHGIANRFATYTTNGLEITAGHFYEQFGSGMALRSYNEPQLGVDNALDGVRVKYRHKEKWSVTGVVGRHRQFFELGKGVVKGVDFEADLSAIFFPLKNEGAARKWTLTKGNSLVSKFELYTGTFDYIPNEVTAFSDRWSLTSPNFSLSVENVFKSPDPSVLNSNITKKGHGLLISSSYTKKGIGINISLQRLDNMNFRSERNDQSLTNLFVNYPQALSKQHTYRLLTLYPQTVQPLGEIGARAEVYYHVKRGSKLGGKYGMNINVNFAKIHGLDTTRLTTQEGYSSKFLAIGPETYYQDISVEISKKVSRRLKLNTAYVNLRYNKTVMEGVPSELVKVHAAVLGLTYKLKNRMSVRAELQHMTAPQDQGSWSLALIEFSKSPHWSVFLSDEYNYDKNIHYYSGGFSYVNGANRVSMSYGRQRAGLLCVGGICRIVPAAKALSLSLSSSF